ncbi:MAG: hypothetical protein M9896_19010 [Candidatus Promineofilum sp.]|uniref:hypothetical protein n=1 Tax=Promineifilum sp. TaxID=2664178 RepID=UPI002411D841|nr:hypothetical protein [Promineifilum sp.]
MRTALRRTLRTYTLHDYDFRYGLQPGFKLMTFPEYGNYDSRVKLVHNAFGNLAYNETRLRLLQSSPAYPPELDLVIEISGRKCRVRIFAMITGYLIAHHP